MTATTTAARNPNTVGDPRLRPRFLHFGAVVRRHRLRLHLSQEKLAERAGCDRRSVNRIENAAYATSLDRAWLLADALGVRLEDLLHEASVGLGQQRMAERSGDS